MKKISKPINLEGFSLIDLFSLLIKNIRIIFFFILFFPTITIIYVSYFSTPIFIANAKFMPSDAKYPEKRLDDLRNKYDVILSPSRIKDVKWSYVDIIQSRTILRSMLKYEFFTKKYGGKKSLFHILLFNELDNSKFNNDELEKIAIEKLRKMIEIREDIKTFTYTLYLSAFEPQLASEIAKLLLQKLDDHQKRFNHYRNDDVIKLIGKRISETKNELKILEDELKLFRIQNRQINNSPNLMIEENRLIRDIGVASSIVSTLMKKYEETKIESFKEIDYIIIIDPPEAPLYRSKPKKKKALIAAVVLSLGFGIMVVLFKEYTINLMAQEKKQFSKIKELLRITL